MPPVEPIGELIRRLRTEQGKSQRRLADVLNAIDGRNPPTLTRHEISRWENGDRIPREWLPAIGKGLNVGLELLEHAAAVAKAGRLGGQAAPGALETALPAVLVAGHLTPSPGMDAHDLDDDMTRRELLRLLSITGALAAVPNLDSPTAATTGVTGADWYERLHPHLWQVFTQAESKRLVYPVVREQLATLIGTLDRSHSESTHKDLCAQAGGLFQLAGEIFFDSDRYTDAAHCYALAADVSKEANAFDLWACALTRHAFIEIFEGRCAEAASILSVAERVSQRGDSQLSTRYWVAAVQAEARAGLGDLDACNCALDTAEQVHALNGPVMPGGWLRFDGSRLSEQRGIYYRELGRADLAEEALTEALNGTTSLRRRGGIQADLAMLGVERRDLDQVLEYGGLAAHAAEQTRSSGYVGRKLQALRGQLGPLLADPRVSLLSERIAQL